MKVARKTEKLFAGFTLQMIGLNDPYTEFHCHETAELACRIALKLDVDRDTIRNIHTAGLLHDVGKQAIPKEILSKPARLTDEEYSLVKTHVMIGVNLLSSMQILNDQSLRYVSEHHERLDGSGYPYGLKGTEISLGGQIIGIADVMSALTSKRTYRKPLNRIEVTAMLHAGQGSHFSEELVNAALAVLDLEKF